MMSMTRILRAYLLAVLANRIDGMQSCCELADRELEHRVVVFFMNSYDPCRAKRSALTLGDHL